MNCCFSALPAPTKVARVTLFVVAFVLTLGCQNIMWRGQNADNATAKLVDKPDEKGTKYIRDAVGVWGMNFSQVEAIALATQLDGTGSDPAPSWQRDQLIKDMEAKNVQNAGKILASDSTSMVIVAASLPPGIRKGERFDVYVTTMPNSETTSLRGGYVMPTYLRPKMVLNGRTRSGHDAASVKGQIQVKALFEPGNDPMAENSGFILGGGVAKEDRPLGLALRDEFAKLRTAMVVSRAINDRFTTYNESGKVRVANPKNDRNISLLVPEAYRQNIGRYVRVVVNIAYDETPEQRINRMEQLERELNEPALAQLAALRLEAIGREAIPALKRALQNQDTEVRFFAAEALTYLDQAEGIAELRRAAERIPDFRWHALTALASSNEVAAGSALTELMQVENAECRYGAFHAMLERSPQDPLMIGQWMPGEFFLHFVPSTLASMIHFSTQNRAEIVVFGGDEPLPSDFIYIENGLTVQAKGGNSIELVKYLPGEGESKIKCANSIAEVVRTMAELGCGYASMLGMCKEATKSEATPCRLVINRLPKSARIYERQGPLEEEFEPITNEDGENASLESTSTGAGANPYLEKAETDSPKKGVFATMKGWFRGK